MVHVCTPIYNTHAPIITRCKLNFAQTVITPCTNFQLLLCQLRLLFLPCCRSYFLAHVPNYLFTNEFPRANYELISFNYGLVMYLPFPEIFVYNFLHENL